MSSPLTHRTVTTALALLADPRRAKTSAWFFKTAKGEYGHGDRFLGVTVPQQRAVAKKFAALRLAETLLLLKSSIHEHRLTAVFLLVQQYRHGDMRERGRIVQTYLANRKQVNNWDLVDSSAPQILGDWLRTHPRTTLLRLARSRYLWDRRIAIVATQALIRAGEYIDTIRVATILLRDSHDLIQKAVGWMLREVGERDRRVLAAFLEKHTHRMPRTMLRYAIEKLPPGAQRRYRAQSRVS